MRASLWISQHSCRGSLRWASTQLSCLSASRACKAAAPARSLPIVSSPPLNKYWWPLLPARSRLCCESSYPKPTLHAYVLNLVSFGLSGHRIACMTFSPAGIRLSSATLAVKYCYSASLDCTSCRMTQTGFHDIQDDTNPPSITLPYGTKFPNLTTTPSLTNNTCNNYIPSDSTLNRFIYVVNFITANGLYVVGCSFSSDRSALIISSVLEPLYLP